MGKCVSKTLTQDEIQNMVNGSFKLICPTAASKTLSCVEDGPTSDKLLVRNVDPAATKKDLFKFFQKFGKVTHVTRDYNCKTEVFVTFAKKVSWYKVYSTLPEELMFRKKYLHIQDSDNNETCSTSHALDAENGTDVCVIDKLPNEMLDYIFSYLSIKERIQTERVCKRWRDIGTNLCWRSTTRLDLGAIETFSEDDSLLLTDHIVLSILSRCGNSVKQLELSTKAAHAQLVTRQTIVTIGKFCPNLTVITLDDLPEVVKFDPKVYLEPLSQGCPKLRHFTILNTSFTDECLSSYFKQCESLSPSRSVALETFALVRNDMVVGDCFQDIAKTLKGLRLFGCYRVLPEIALEMLMARCHNIEELSIRYCCELLKPPLLLQVLRYYKLTLKVLRLDGHGFIPAVWNEGLRLLVSAEKVSLEKCRGVTDEVIITSATNCLNLSVLNVSGTCVTDVGISGLAKHCANLRALNICETLITDAGVSALAVECVHLRALNVSFTPITDVGVSVLASASNLKVLDISYTSNVTGIGIYDLAEKGQIEELYVRAINRRDNVVQESCIALSKFCRNFRVLDVRATKNIDNTLVEEFRSALQKGNVKGPVYLNVGLTQVQEEIRQTDRLKVCFDTTFRIDFFNNDYFDGN